MCGCSLPAEMLLEIVARSDAATLVRCAASCKPLRRGIVNPAFIRRVCREPDGIVPPSLLGFIDLNPEARRKGIFSLAHPATPAAASFSEKHLAPLLSRSGAAAAAGGLVGFTSLESRNGLVLLNRLRLSRMLDRLCVYDPMTSNCTFFPGPPDSKCRFVSYEYVLLTAADGIVASSSFLLLAASFSGPMYGSLKVRTMPSDRCTWSPITVASYSGQRRRQCGGAAVIGSLIHWLTCDDNDRDFQIVTYDVCTATAGSVQLPLEGLPDQCSNIHLTSTPDGGLRLLVVDKLTISVWLLSGSAAGWTHQAMIDTKATVRSMVRSSNTDMLQIVASGVKSGVVLLRPFSRNYFDNLEEDVDTQTIIVLDVDTKETRKAKRCNMLYIPYEVDLKARLLAMKTF
ncbi:hypothetical protein EJB05_05560, partial [Eragrostis curvula]